MVFAALPEQCLSTEEIETIRQIGDDAGCMALKGASHRHEGQEPRADEWPLRPDLLAKSRRAGVWEQAGSTFACWRFRDERVTTIHD